VSAVSAGYAPLEDELDELDEPDPELEPEELELELEPDDAAGFDSEEPPLVPEPLDEPSAPPLPPPARESVR
jgi:hypothetical protein